MKDDLGFIHKFVRGTSERTLLLLHGTGGNEHDFLPLGREMDPEASLLSPRGPVLENGQPRFFRRFAEGVFDLDDLRQRTDDLARFVLSAADHYQFDPNKLVAIGYSNGANIAASVLLLRPNILKSAILFRAMVPLAPERTPDLSGVRVWIAGGKHDTLISPEETQQLANTLQAAGAEVVLRLFETGHGLTNVEIVFAQRWLTGARPEA